MTEPDPSLIPIDRPDDPRVAPYMNQKDAWLRARHRPNVRLRDPDVSGTGLPPDLPTGLFIAEGTLVLEQLAASDHEIVSVLVARERLDAIAGTLRRLPRQMPVYVADRPVLAEIVGFELHRGVLACGRRASEPRVEDVLARARAVVVLEDLANHDNVGGIFRTVSAIVGPGAGGGAVLLSPGCCDPLYRKSLRVSMGHALRVPFATLEPWPHGLDRVRRAGFTVVALTPAEGVSNIDEISSDPPGRPALLLGAEGPGLSPEAVAGSDLRVRIPISPGVDSLNVGVAAGIALHRLCPPASPG